MIRNLILGAFSVFLLAVFLGCQNELSSSGSGKKTVYVDSYPLAYFAEQISDGELDVICPVPVGVSPQDWKPSADDIAKFQSANLIIINGAGLSPWIEKASLPASKIVDISKTFEDKIIKIEESATHSHGPDGEHSHSGIANVFWMDLSLAHAQAEAVCAALQKAFPTNKEMFEENTSTFVFRIDGIHQGMENVIPSLAPYKVVASHPVYHYLARQYNLKMEYVDWEPNKAPTAEQLDQLKKMAPQIFIWESNPSPEADKFVKDLGIMTIVIDTCAAKPAVGDWSTVMKTNVGNVKAAYMKMVSDQKKSAE